MKIQMARAIFTSTVGRNLRLIRQHAVLVIKHLQPARVLGFLRRDFIATGDQYHVPVVGRDTHLVRKDTGVDRRLLDLRTWREIRVDPIDPQRAGVIKGHQQVLRGNVGGHMNRAGRQPDRFSVQAQGATRRVNAVCRHMMIGARRTVARGAAAGGDIKIFSRHMWPAVLHAGGQTHRVAPNQRGVGDVNIEMHQLFTDVCVQRNLARTRLRMGKAGNNHATGNE